MPDTFDNPFFPGVVLFLVFPYYSVCFIIASVITDTYLKAAEGLAENRI